MARTVDAAAQQRRRAQLVAAVFRIVRRDGVDQVSVRNVAREAGLSAGSLRHYFATQSELLAFSLGEVECRLRDRLANLDSTGSPRQILERMLHHLLPIAPDARVEHEIWLAFVGRVIVDPVLRGLNARVYDEVRALLARTLPQIGVAIDDLDMETERLYALIDGLALHATLRPEHWSPARLSAVLRHHLDTLP